MNFVFVFISNLSVNGIGVSEVKTSKRRFVQPEKTVLSIFVSLCGIYIDVSFLQLEKAPFPILVTLSEISVDTKFVQSEYLYLITTQRHIC